MKTSINNTAITGIKGGHIQTRESFLYGRFETIFKPPYGSGVVSSFFTFYNGPAFIMIGMKSIGNFLAGIQIALIQM